MLKQIHKVKKRGVSEMVSYVILIVITLTMSIGVYAWLKWQVPQCSESDPDCILPEDCNDGTYIRISDYKCDTSGINITFENNGMFNISGIITSFSDDRNEIPEYYLNILFGGIENKRPGELLFKSPLSPGDEYSVYFSKIQPKGTPMTKIEKIQLQPFISKGKGRVLCKNIILREEINNCIF